MARIRKPSGQKRGKSRSIRSLQRSQGNREPRKVILIVCEGKKTEPMYFNGLKQDCRISSLSIQIIPGQGAPISIVRRAIQEKKHLAQSDEVWCVFDVEQANENATFSQAILLAKNSKIKLAISNPSFEYWYLLHFERTNQFFINAHAVITQLRKHLPQYEKNLNVYQRLKNKTSTAIKYASELRTSSQDIEDSFPNSSTTVDILVSRILNL